jgi:hypothetical protein
MAQLSRRIPPAQRFAKHQTAQHVEQDHRGVGLDQHLAGGEQRIGRPQRKVRILDAAVAHNRKAMADSDAQRGNTAEQLQPQRMTLEAKIPSHRAMLPA